MRDREREERRGEIMKKKWKERIFSHYLTK